MELTAKQQQPAKHLKSCARCRKHKTKCNYSANAPNACSSCQKRGLSCHFETVFPIKRSNIIKNLAQDIDALKLLVNDLIVRENNLQMLCNDNGVKLIGLLDVPQYNIQSLDSEYYSDEEIVDFTLINCPNIHYSINQVNSLFNNFNIHYLKFIPIFNSTDPVSLYKEEPLTFWTIIFILTQNTPIFSNYIVKSIMDNLHGNLQPMEKPQYIKSILLLSCFPSKNIQTGLDKDDELDTTIFQWLNHIKSWVDNSSLNDIPNLEEIKALVLIYGTFASLRLGIKWNQSFDCDIEFCNGKGYIPQMLNIGILLNKLLNTISFQEENLEFSNDHLILKSLQNWEFKFNSFKEKFQCNSNSGLDSIQLDSVDSIFKFITLIFTLLKPNDDKPKFIATCITQCNDLFQSIEKMELNSCPLYHMISLEFLALVMTKVIYSPQNKNVKLDQINLFTNIFNKCLNSIDFNDMRPILNIIMDFDSNLKLDSSLLKIDNFNSFKSQFIQGIIQDLKINCHKFQSSYTIPSTKEFEIENINFQKYLTSFNWIRSNLDLIILFSNKMFQQDPVSTSSSISVSPNVSNHLDLVPPEIQIKQEGDLDNFNFLELNSWT